MSEKAKLRLVKAVVFALLLTIGIVNSIAAKSFTPLVGAVIGIALMSFVSHQMRGN